MGDIPTCHINRAAKIGMITVFGVTPAALPICHNGAAIRATTAGRMPLNTRSTTGLSLKSVNKMAISRIMMKEGKMVPRLEKTTPLPFLAL